LNSEGFHILIVYTLSSLAREKKREKEFEGENRLVRFLCHRRGEGREKGKDPGGLRQPTLLSPSSTKQKGRGRPKRGYFLPFPLYLSIH